MDFTPIRNNDEEVDYNEDDQAITTQPMFKCNTCHNIFMEVRTYGTVVITQGYYNNEDSEENFTMFYGVTPYEYDYHQRTHPEKCKTPSMVREERDFFKNGIHGNNSGRDPNFDPDFVSAPVKGGLDPNFDPDFMSFNKKPKVKKKTGGIHLVKLKRPIVSRKTSKN